MIKSNGQQYLSTDRSVADEIRDPHKALTDPGTISLRDMDLAFLTDDASEGVEYIKKFISRQNPLKEENPDSEQF
jgi:hypothetical protein